MKYDYKNNEVNLDGDGEYMLVLNEVKVYDERDSYKDFAIMLVERFIQDYSKQMLGIFIQQIALVLQIHLKMQNTQELI